MRNTPHEEVPPTPRTARYLLAKYIPDLQRMEPRNVGVLLWTPDGTAARFLGEKESGEIDGRSVASLVQSLGAYREWVRFWQEGVRESGSLPDPEASWQRFWRLRRGNRAAYLLADGGMLMDEVSPARLEALVQHLYATLVQSAAHEERPVSLEARCRRLFEQTGIAASPYFHEDFEVVYQAQGQTREMPFDYALKNGALKGVFERVPLGAGPVRKAAYSAAYKFERVREAQLLPREQTGVFVDLNEQQFAQPKIQAYLSDLRAVTQVLNLGQTRLPDIGDAETTRTRLERVLSTL